MSDVLIKDYIYSDGHIGKCAIVAGYAITRDSHVYVNEHYTSRINHCDSCISEQERDYSSSDCCCIHDSFGDKKTENEWVKAHGFWKLPLPHVGRAAQLNGGGEDWDE